MTDRDQTLTDVLAAYGMAAQLAHDRRGRRQLIVTTADRRAGLLTITTSGETLLADWHVTTLEARPTLGDLRAFHHAVYGLAATTYVRLTPRTGSSSTAFDRGDQLAQLCGRLDGTDPLHPTT